MMKKTVLVYGDSNTWGWSGFASVRGDNGEIRDGDCRYDENTRYPKALEKLLGDGWYVIEEGCSSRTTVYDSDVDDFANGKKYLYPCLHSHMPLDYFVMMLGTNDLSNGCHMNAYYAAAGCDRLINVVKNYCSDMGQKLPRIILISPPLIEKPEYLIFEDVFNYSVSIEESKKFRKYYSDVARIKECEFIAAEDFARTGPDGIHMTAQSHLKLARGIYDIIMNLENR